MVAAGDWWACCAPGLRPGEALAQLAVSLVVVLVWATDGIAVRLVVELSQGAGWAGGGTRLRVLPVELGLDGESVWSVLAVGCGAR